MLQDLFGEKFRLGCCNRQHQTVFLQLLQHLFNALIHGVFKHAACSKVFPVISDRFQCFIMIKSKPLLKRMNQRRANKGAQIVFLCLDAIFF